MDRNLLLKATNVEDGPIPIYLLDEISKSAYENEENLLRLKNFLLKRLEKTNSNVKYKTLCIIKHLLIGGRRDSFLMFKEDCQEIQEHVNYTSPLDPNGTDIKNRKIRAIAEEIMSILFIPEEKPRYTIEDTERQMQQMGILEDRRGVYPGVRTAFAPHRSMSVSPTRRYDWEDTSPSTNRNSLPGSVPDAMIPRTMPPKRVWGKHGYQETENEPNQVIYPTTSKTRNPNDNLPTVLVGMKTESQWKEKITSTISSKFPDTFYTGERHGKEKSKMDIFKKKLEELKKKGLSVKEKWECRRLDKSMCSSLSEHDDYCEKKGTYRVSLPKEFTPNSTQEETGNYERNIVNDVCTASILVKNPSPKELYDFVDKVKLLNVELIGSLLLQKLIEPMWQVRYKALCVIEALIKSPQCLNFKEYFLSKANEFQSLANEKKSPIKTKAEDILHHLQVPIGQTSSNIWSIEHKRLEQPKETMVPLKRNDNVDLLQF